jgi:TRAP transporter 4TM/12TM fusion protein
MFASALAFTLAALALYWTQYSIGTTQYRAAFLALVLTLAFLLYPVRQSGRWRDRIWIADAVLIALCVVSLAYLATHLEAVKMRATRPTELEIALGAALILGVLEATRRTTGATLPIIALIFLAYAFLGPFVPEPLDHRGYSIARIVGQNYLTLEGVFSTPLDVAATFIILFTIYGAVLDRGGAGKFFIAWAFALFGRNPNAASPGRATVSAGFLLGSVSGSGVATTVTLATLAWPMLKQSGYPPAVAGGILSAAGIGAILSPPTLGAAAFIIAEYLKVSYFDILVMAAGPTMLYYLSAWAMVDADAHRMGIKPVPISDQSLWALTRSHGHHFLSLLTIAGLLAAGLTAFMAVFWSIVAAFALSLLRTETRLASLPASLIGAAAFAGAIAIGERVSAAAFWGLAAAMLASSHFRGTPKTFGASESKPLAGIICALIDGGKGVVGVAATCACAGIIVSVITLTGLGLKISGVIGDWGQGSTFLTILFAALAMWILGTAVPVTASYIIGAVTLAPALTGAGVPEAAAHMFLFYYAVLGDVTPPTALAPFAAAAITRASPFSTMAHAWRYCLPAFVVPFMFCLTPQGAGLIWQASLSENLIALSTASIGVFGIAMGIGGWIRKDADAAERLAMGLGGVLLLYGDLAADAAGAALCAGAYGAHIFRHRHTA